MVDIKNNIDKTIQDLKALLDVSKAMAVEKNLDSLLHLIMSETTRVMNADRSSLFIVDYTTGELWSRIAQNAEINEIRFPIGIGIAGTVAKTRETINIKEAYDDDRFNREIDKKTGYRTKSILCMPLINHEDNVIGVIQVLNKKVGYFTKYDEELLAALAAQAAIAIENAELYRERELLFESMARTLAAAIDARDPVTAGHSHRVAQYALNLGRALNFNEDQLKQLEYAAILHDVGKIGVRDDVLLKPGILTPEEYKKIQAHVVYTQEILKQIRFPRKLTNVPEIAIRHHERVDGTGYPGGLTGDQLSVAAKILAIVDVYDALTAYDRPYKKAMPIQKALDILIKGKGSAFDSALVDLFIEKKLYLIEQREFRRLSSHISLEYRVMLEDEKALAGIHQEETENIPASGLKFKTKLYIPPGKFVALTLSGDDFNFELIAQVVRAERDEIGMNYEICVKFLSLPAEVKARLAQYLDLSLGEIENKND